MFVRMRKAVRARGRRPAYQDTRPGTQEQRDAWAIATRHESRFARAFLRLSRSMLADPRVRRDLLRALAGDSVEDAVRTLPWFNPNDLSSRNRWSRYGAALQRAYMELVQEGGQASLNELDVPLGFEVVTKAIGSDARGVPVVPVNPFSLNWILGRVGERIVETSDTQQDAIRNLIFDSFAEGRRPREILEEIERTVGLTSRETRAVTRRRRLALEAGASAARADEVADKYATQLLRKRAKRVARTETIDAQSQGRNDAWQLAREEGFLPPEAMREWVADVPGGGRTCPICIGLDGTFAAIGEFYQSDLIGAVARPTAHPHCRCTEILVFPDISGVG